jgi:hypothetical protein
MEKFLELRLKALEYLKVADQSIKFTYQLVKDNKVLVTAVNGLFMAMASAIGSLLYYELKYKRVPAFEDNFEAKYQLMRTNVLERYHIDPSYLKLARQLKDLVIAHKNSPIEFSREGKFVICSDDYKIKEITPDSLREAYAKTKLFIEEVITLTKNERATF